MSVLKIRRTQSKVEYVNTANKIYVKTLSFLTRLSARYSRLFAGPVSKLASEVVEHTEKANSIFPNDDVSRDLRRTHLLEARASLMALDIQLANCYDIMMLNPAGCFSKGDENCVEVFDAKRKLERMAQELGEAIDLENRLITGVLKVYNS